MDYETWKRVISGEVKEDTCGYLDAIAIGIICFVVLLSIYMITTA